MGFAKKARRRLVGDKGKEVSRNGRNDAMFKAFFVAPVRWKLSAGIGVA